MATIWSYSFDISYCPEENKCTDDTVFNITDDYETCDWYVSDSTTFIDSDPDSPENQNVTHAKNNGFRITSSDDLKEIIRRVAEIDGIYIDLITGFTQTSDSSAGTVEVEVYRSKMNLKLATSDFVAEYSSGLSQLDLVNREIHNLCVVGE